MSELESRPVWRVALQPRWLGGLAVVVVLCAAFGWLGHWQLDVARSKEKSHHPAVHTAVPLEQVVSPQQTFRNNMVARPVTVTGGYDAGRQLLVSGKRQHGVDGFWVLTALRTSSGALVPVVRGFVPEALVADAAAGGSAALVPPTGQVSLSGALEPPDPAPADGDGPSVPAGQIPAADTADVVNLWGSPIFNVLLYATAPPAGGAATGSALQLVPAPPADQGGGLDLRNAAYAVQWWLFAAFAVLMWWRMVRQDAVDGAAAAIARPKELSTP